MCGRLLLEDSLLYTYISPIDSSAHYYFSVQPLEAYGR